MKKSRQFNRKTFKHREDLTIEAKDYYYEYKSLWYNLANYFDFLVDNPLNIGEYFKVKCADGQYCYFFRVKCIDDDQYTFFYPIFYKRNDEQGEVLFPTIQI